MQGLNAELLQLSVGDVPQDRNAKKIQTQLGEIEVKKRYLLVPAGKFRQSAYLQESALFLGQAQTFSYASELLERFSSRQLSDKQIKNLCYHYDYRPTAMSSPKESSGMV